MAFVRGELAQNRVAIIVLGLLISMHRLGCYLEIHFVRLGG